MLSLDVSVHVNEWLRIFWDWCLRNMVHPSVRTQFRVNTLNTETKGTYGSRMWLLKPYCLPNFWMNVSFSFSIYLLANINITIISSIWDFVFLIDVFVFQWFLHFPNVAVSGPVPFFSSSSLHSIPRINHLWDVFPTYSSSLICFLSSYISD